MTDNTLIFKRKVLPLLILVLVLLPVFYYTALLRNSRSSTYVTLNNTQLYDESRNFFELEIGLTDVVDLFGLSLYIFYDKDKLQIVNVEEGVFFLNGGKNSMIAVNRIQNENGIYQYGRFLVGERDGVEGDGNILKIRYYYISESNPVFKFVDDVSQVKIRNNNRKDTHIGIKLVLVDGYGQATQFRTAH